MKNTNKPSFKHSCKRISARFGCSMTLLFASLLSAVPALAEEDPVRVINKWFPNAGRRRHHHVRQGNP